MAIITRTHVIRQVKLKIQKKGVRKARHAGLVPRRLATALGVRQARHVGLVPRRLPPPTQIEIFSACAQNMDFSKKPKKRKFANIPNPKSKNPKSNYEHRVPSINPSFIYIAQFAVAAFIFYTR